MRSNLSDIGVIKRIGALAFGKANNAVELVFLDPQDDPIISIRSKKQIRNLCLLACGSDLFVLVEEGGFEPPKS